MPAELSRIHHRKGFTLVELIVILVVLGILAAILIPSFLGYIDSAKRKVDETNLAQLNETTRLYAILNEMKDGDIFKGIYTDADRMGALVSGDYLDSDLTPLEHDIYFHWSIGDQVWLLSDTQYGDSFTDISAYMIASIQEHFSQTGKYGRTFGTYTFTDIGLNPDDWANPINHIIYSPGGSKVSVKPEDGYTLVVQSAAGTTLRLPASYHWYLVYSDITQKWYYHTIDAANEINMDTLEVIRS